MNENVKESPSVVSEAVTTKPAWHAPVLEEVDYIRTQASAVFLYPGTDAVFYTG